MLSPINSLHYSWWNLTCLSSILTRYITTHLSNSWPAFVCVTQFCGAQCRIFAFFPEFWAGRVGMSNLKEKECFVSLWSPFTWNVMFKRTRSRPGLFTIWPDFITLVVLIFLNFDITWSIFHWGILISCPYKVSLYKKLCTIGQIYGTVKSDIKILARVLAPLRGAITYG